MNSKQSSPCSDYKYDGEFVMDGVVYCTPMSAEGIHRAREVKLTTQDVVIVSFPKSGTTWLKYVTHLILNKDLLEKPEQEENLLDDVGYLEFMFPIDKHLSRPPPRAFASHLFPHHLKHLMEKKVKFIHIRRDLKDTLTSFYHFYRMSEFLGKFQGSFDEFFEFFKMKRLPYGDPVAHNQAWWDAGENSIILYLTYEEMKEDLFGSIKKIAAFLDTPVSEDAVEKIAQMSSFSIMKSNDYANYTDLAKMGLFDFSVSLFMRKGEIGDWKEHFTPESEAYLEERMKETNVVYGYTGNRPQQM